MAILSTPGSLPEHRPTCKNLTRSKAWWPRWTGKMLIPMPSFPSSSSSRSEKPDLAKICLTNGATLTPVTPGRTPTAAAQTPTLCSIRPATKGPASCWRARILAAARRASMRLGRLTNSDFAPSSPRVTQIFFSTTASKTGCCQLCCQRRR